MPNPDATSASPPSDAGERAAALFEFLTKLIELRSRPVRDVDEYEDHVWLGDVPDEPEVTSAIGRVDSVDEWLAVRRPRFRAKPEVPDDLKPWVVDESASGDLEAPTLSEVCYDEDGSEIVPSERIRASWTRYRSDWESWATERARIAPVFDLYQRLFDIQQKGEQLGEQYEVVVGLGLLYARTSTGSVRRHLLTAKAKVVYENATGRIALVPDPDGIDAAIETEMLDAAMTASAATASTLRTRIAELGTALLDIAVLEPILTTWINSVSTDGAVDTSPVPPRTRPAREPAIVFAPALVLRRRTQRSLIAMYRDLIAAFRAGIEPPPLVRGLVEILEAEDQRPPDDIGDDTEIYFPLPANDEQRRIVERLRSNRGVVVAGPPGTGKSHTIANLVSNALAHGQRVVVTSHTARALEVLVEKLPDDVRDLCVIMAGEGRGLSAELRRSIDALLNRSSSPEWTPERVASRIKRANAQLIEVEAERVEVLTERRRLRQSASEGLTAPFGVYSGTLARIAEKIAREASSYGWIPDEVSSDAPISGAAALEWLDLERRLDLDALTRAAKPAPEESSVPEPNDFQSLVDEVANTTAVIDRLAALRTHTDWSVLLTASSDARERFRSGLATLRRERDRLSDERQPWIGEAVTDVLAGREQPWVARAQVLQQVMTVLEQHATSADAVRIAGVGSVDVRSARVVATRLRDRLATGGRYGIGPFKPSVVRDFEAVVAGATVDGAAPRTAEHLTGLVAHLACLDALDDLQRSWGDRLPVGDGAFGLALAHFREEHERLGPILGLQGPLDAARIAGEAIDDLSVSSWTDRTALRLLEDAVGAVDAVRRREEAEGRLEAIALLLREGADHPEVGAIREAVEQRDPGSYARAHVAVIGLLSLRRDVARRDELLERVRIVAPLLAGAVRDQPMAPEWDGWCAEFEASWTHSRVVDWVRKLAADGGASELDARLARLDERHRQLLGQVGALKAWEHALSRLTQQHKANLLGYRMAMTNYGKGMGKYAATHLAAARAYMQKCVDAVPAWIMPTYRLADSLKAEIEPFDLAIVDEASQSGVDGLFVWALAKQVIVVGDDQQISPDAVGIDQSEVFVLQDQLIRSVPFKDLFTPSTSIFDQALLRYPGQLQLREHFRCMPEIIKFSNDLCYSASPLQPVRQFGTDRLDPLVAVYVAGAEEKDHVNRLEASAIVEKIAECCADPRYADASMGVISLTGDRQAKFIQRRLIERIGPDLMLKHHIKCGDAYAFQGDERRVMFLSMLVAPSASGHRLSAQVAKNIMQRFNVAASRAKDQAWLFHSVTQNDLNPDCLRSKLLAHFLHGGAPHRPHDVIDVSDVTRDDRFDSLFEQRVYRGIAERGYDVAPQFEVLGYRIDLVIIGGAARLAIECDGDAWHGPEQFDHDTARQRDLERCGWTFVRVVESDFYLDKGEAMAPVWAALDRLDIQPMGHPVTQVLEPLLAVRGREAAVRKGSLATRVVTEASTGVGDGDTVPDAPLIPVKEQIAADQPTAGIAKDRIDSAVAETDGGLKSPEAMQVLATPRDPGMDVGTGRSAGSGSAPLAPSVIGPSASSAISTGQDDLGLDRGSQPLRPGPARLQPYQAYAPRPMPILTAPSPSVESAVLRIAIAEGPLTVGRLRRVYGRGLGRNDLSHVQRTVLNRTVSKLINERRLAVEVSLAVRTMSDWSLRIPGLPIATPRERGPRALGDVPLSELAAVASQLRETMRAGSVIEEVLALYGVPSPTRQQDEYVRRAIDPHWALANTPTHEAPPQDVGPEPASARDTARANKEFKGLLSLVVNEVLALGSRRLRLLGASWVDDEESELIRRQFLDSLRALGVGLDLDAITVLVRENLPDATGPARGAVVDLVLARALSGKMDEAAIDRLTSPMRAARDSIEGSEERRCAHGRAWGTCRVGACLGRSAAAMPADYDWRLDS